MIRIPVLICVSAFAGHAFAQVPTNAAASCEKLKSLALPNTTIKTAEFVPAGPYTPPGPAAPGRKAPPEMLPAHCRVDAFLAPSSDSNIEIEVWLPASNWNGKFQAVGNGGWSGSIVYQALVPALKEGYATASTDTGHKGQDASFTYGHPEKLIDFGYRAVHEMTVKSKALVAAYYGRGPRLSYWNGCSSGGKQGLKEAQKYPDDYDAILAGAPANFQTHLHAWSMWVALADEKDPASFIPHSKYPMIHAAVLAACDALDGVKDGLLNDPRLCHFDPSTLLCRGADAANCLTAPQVEAVKKIYAPAVNSKTGALIFPPMEPGSELGWGILAGGKQPAEVAATEFKYLVHNDPNWDWRKFDLDRDTAAADKQDHGTMNATDPNLSQFKAHGGKLLMYHGWSDQLIAPENSINYYSSVLSAMGPDQDDFIRLFMVPGMQHCRGGEGPDQFNAVGALERWRESGETPRQITAYHVTNNAVDRSRPLCPYPQVAKWTGVGNTDDAANFVCRAPAAP